MPSDVEPAELQAALDGPAVAANRFVVTVGPSVRVAFLEQLPGTPPRFRSAVSLTHDDAVDLARVLGGLLASTQHPKADPGAASEEK